jgi:hypothetical protein
MRSKKKNDYCDGVGCHCVVEKKYIPKKRVLLSEYHLMNAKERKVFREKKIVKIQQDCPLGGLGI